MLLIVSTILRYGTNLRMGENTFRRTCNFKELRVVKGHIFQLVRYLPDGSLVPHRPNKLFHVTASTEFFELALYTTRDHDWAFETVHDADSSRYVRCAPNAVDDRTGDHHADRSSVLDMLLALIVR